MDCKHNGNGRARSPGVSDRILRVLDQIEDGVKDMQSGWNLPRECYVDQEFYDFEQEAVFMRSWLCLGRVDEIKNPGDFVRIDMGDEPLVMVRDQNMEIRVFTPICAHRGHLLCEGSGNAGRLFRCPFHAWTYGLDGHLIAAPSMNDTIGSLNRISGHVAAVVEQQTAAAVGLAANIGRVANETVVAGEHIEFASRMATETDVAAGQIADSADRLSRQSTHLDQEVAQFLGHIRAA